MSSALKERVERIHKRIQKKENSKEKFIHDLKYRAAGRPVKREAKAIHLGRRIVQLFLLLYKRPLQGPSIISLINNCFRYRLKITDSYLALEKRGTNYEQFIVFCYWYLNEYPMKIHKALYWVVANSVIDLAKYETNAELWSDAYKLIQSTKRGVKLLRLVKVNVHHMQQVTYLIMDDLKKDST